MRTWTSSEEKREEEEEKLHNMYFFTMNIPVQNKRRFIIMN